MSAKFITLEGIEGVGKSTQIKLIANYLQQQNKQVIITREPGGTPLAEEIRNLLLIPREETVAQDTELLLMYASRAQHVAQVIKPALQQNKWVISDRFIDATYAYQGGGRQINLARIQELNAWTLGQFSPDLTLLLDAPYVVGKMRADNRGQAEDRFEKEREDFFNAVRAAYLQRAKLEPNRIKIIDATRSIDEVWQDIQVILDKL